MKYYMIKVDNRLLELMKTERELRVSEDEFEKALKGYKFDEFLIILAQISAKLFDRNFTENDFWKKESVGFIIHKSSKQFITDFAVEYIANILLISGSSNFKKESIKNNDNIISLFSIYHNSIIQPVDKSNIALSIFVPMFYQQMTSQQDIKNLFIRQWLIFKKSHELVSEEERIDLNQILIERIGINVAEYLKLCFLVLAVILKSPIFSFGSLENSTIPGLKDILNRQKISAIFKQLSITKEGFIKLDKRYNSQLDPKYTKSRYNPLWEKPIIILGNNNYVAPSLSAYAKGAIRGLYWIFENSKGKLFRDYFGVLFENYCGMIIQDIFSVKNVRVGIKFGKENKEFFDWIVDNKGEIILFEAKAYQFPLKTLQTGDSKLIKKEIFNKLVETIKQMYQRCQDIDRNKELKEFKNKKITVVGIFYDMPFVSTSLYDIDIKLALSELDSAYPGIKNFDYIFLSIEELENYTYIKDCISIKSLIDRVRNTPGSGVLSETRKVFKENNLSSKQHKSLLDRGFKDFYSQELGIFE